MLGDSGYTGADSRPELQDSKAAFFIARKRGKVKAIKNARDRRQHERWESCKANIRAKVEHPFRVSLATPWCAIAGWPRTARRC